MIIASLKKVGDTMRDLFRVTQESLCKKLSPLAKILGTGLLVATAAGVLSGCAVGVGYPLYDPQMYYPRSSYSYYYAPSPYYYVAPPRLNLWVYPDHYNNRRNHRPHYEGRHHQPRHSHRFRR